MDAFFVSAGAIALAELGDKTQLLAFILAARLKQPLVIILGILAATLVNHSIASAFGLWISTIITPEYLRGLLAITFFLMALWLLMPEQLDADKISINQRLGVFGTSFIVFFLAEIGDKTQIATIALSAHYASPVIVTLGTTFGMLLADVPAVFIGATLSQNVSLKWLRFVASALFALMAVLTFIVD